jgi:hypothetical protein
LTLDDVRDVLALEAREGAKELLDARARGDHDDEIYWDAYVEAREELLVLIARMREDAE